MNRPMVYTGFRGRPSVEIPKGFKYIERQRTAKDLGQEFGVSAATIQRWRKKLGLSRKMANAN